MKFNAEKVYHINIKDDYTHNFDNFDVTRAYLETSDQC